MRSSWITGVGPVSSQGPWRGRQEGQSLRCDSSSRGQGQRGLKSLHRWPGRRRRGREPGTRSFWKLEKMRPSIPQEEPALLTP